MTCESCGHSLPATARFCPECGEERAAPRALKAAGLAVAVETRVVPAARPASSSEPSRPAAEAGSPSLPARPAAPVARPSTGVSLETLLARANLARMRGKWTEAIEWGTEALRLDPHSAAAHSLLGDIYENQGRLEKAIHWYQLAIEQNPDSVADQAKLARARELQAVRRRTACPRMSWAYLVAVAGVAFLFVSFAMAAIVAHENRLTPSAVTNARLLDYPTHVAPVEKPPDHTTLEDAICKSLEAELGSPFMYVTGVTLDPLQKEATVAVRMDDRAITPDPLGGGARGRILREGYRIASLTLQEMHQRGLDLRYVTIRALSELSSDSGATTWDYVWWGRIDVNRLGVGDDRASAAEVRSVYDPKSLYWNPIAGF